MTSPDGVNWTSRTSAADNSWRGITYGNGLFVAVAFTGTGNRVMTSPDGITWTIRTSPVDNTWEGIVYGNGQFVSVADTGDSYRVMTSGKQELMSVSNNNTYQGGITVYGSSVIKSDVNSTTAFQIQNAAGTNVVNVDTTTSQLSVRALPSGAGPELAGSTVCSGGSWTGSGPWTTSSSGDVMTCAPPTVTAGATYQLIFTAEAPVFGSFSVTPSIGGTTGAVVSGFGSPTTSTQYITAASTASLTFTSGFGGVKVSNISVKQVIASNATLQVLNSDGSAGLELRAGGIGLNNSFIGVQSGQNSLGINNVGVGNYALQSNVAGNNNAAFGYSALKSNTSGSLNSAFGSFALQNNTTGDNNVGLGYQALNTNTTGVGNAAVGYQALYSNTSGGLNTAIGQGALYGNTSGSGNQAVGWRALEANTTGTYNIGIGTTAQFFNTTGNNNTALGYFSGTISGRTALDSSTAIGANSGVGSNNTVALGCTNGFNSCSANSSVAIGSPFSAIPLSVGATTYTTGPLPRLALL